MKNWNKPKMVELSIKSTEKNNRNHYGNHYGWNNQQNPHCCYGCDDNEDIDTDIIS